MATFSVRLNDVGEGVAEAELIEWQVSEGDVVEEDQVLGVVMTDKAAVEIPSSKLGKVVWLGAKIGDIVAVGAELVRLEIAGDSHQKSSDDPSPANVAPTEAPQSIKPSERTESSPEPIRNKTKPLEKPLAAPSVRRRAKESGVDLAQVTGTGPGGRILHEDIDGFSTSGEKNKSRTANTQVKQINVVGLRRKIAEKMALANSRIPHITIVEEVDVNNLEELRHELNEQHATTRAKLTLLPFVMKAVVEAVQEQPEINAHFDDEAEIITQHAGVHIGIATQTPLGLLVPVVTHCEVNSLWENADAVGVLAEQARSGDAKRESLSGSTITITSLGPLGAIATTPIINHPEVAIVGINKIAIRPHWDGQQFVPRKKVNISCSFDHRVIDGWDAAIFVQKLKSLLETPALLFVEN